LLLSLTKLKKQKRFLTVALAVIYLCSFLFSVSHVSHENNFNVVQSSPALSWFYDNAGFSSGMTTTAIAKETRKSNTTTWLEGLSSVDYYACCGLGHRLIRTSSAYYVSKQMNFSFRSFWGWCGENEPVEVFSYLFRPYFVSEVSHVNSQNLILPFYNEVPGFQAIVRRKDKTANDTLSCICRDDKIQSDLEMYTSLRERFRGKAVVDQFVKEHFVNASLVIGIHVRAGNGEGGDFERKGRGIANPDTWVQHMQSLIQNSLQLLIPTSTSNRHFSSPLLYIATDTPSMVDRFRQQFATVNITVLNLPQQGRPEEGKGVLFGESDKVHNKDGKESNDDYSSCLRGWSDTITDMMILSHADVVVAAKPSSFVQTLPMSLAFGRTTFGRKLPKVYCEIIPQFEQDENNLEWIEGFPTIQCYDSYHDWCCNHNSKLTRRDIHVLSF
jgi:hypothetical protein